MPKKQLFYFDSCSSSDIPEGIKNFLDIYKKAYWKITMSVIRQQFGDTECGTYCLYYATQFASGEDIQRLATIGRSDSFIKEFRNFKQPSVT